MRNLRSQQAISARIEAYFGAHAVPQRDEHEKERAFQREGIVSIVCLLFLSDLLFSNTSWSAAKGVVLWFLFAYLVSSVAYRSLLRAHPGKGIGAQYVYLVLDPVLLILLLVVDAPRIAFLNPFLLLVIIRCGIRYGTRTMWLAWSVTFIAATVFLPFSNYWRKETEATLAFGLLLMLIPAFFISLIRRVHKVRLIEEERARLRAMHEVVSARSAFLAKVSHELRSPLQSIVSALDVFEMRHGREGADDDELIGRMRRSSMLLNTQLRDLLTLAKGESGHLQMHPEPFEARALLEGVALAARDAASAKGLELQVTLPREAVFAVADGARIDQVLTNLVVNSVRYTYSGHVQLTLHPYDAATRRLHFTVADTGPGIPQAMLPSLLEPDKLVTPPERKGEGSGLGLAVVRTLMSHLGGEVSVSSVEGDGTRFDLRIPAELIDADSPGAPAGLPADRILIVDDRDDVLTGLTSVLNEIGYECDRAATAALAAELLATRRYDAVLFDIQTPLKSGADLAAETRAGDGPNRNTYLIGMSAAEVAVRYEKGPFDAYLSKPIDRNALVSTLRGRSLQT